MSLDRPTVEKHDFPVARKGYEREAVDAHLRALADRFEAEWPDTVASMASQQVQAIVSAAESAATSLRRQAEEEATSTTQAASRDAKRTRREATQQAKQYVEDAREATAGMLERVRTLEAEIDSLMSDIRARSAGLGDELAELERGLGVLTAASDTWTGGDDLRSDEDAEAQPTAQEKARMVALDMALDGISREDTDRHLAEHFELERRDQLLDEVYSEIEQANA